MSQNAVHIDNLTVYYGKTPALTNVCLDVEDGEYLGIIGPNGGGKSSLLKAVLGLVPASSGVVTVYGERAEEADLPSAMCRKARRWIETFRSPCGRS